MFCEAEAGRSRRRRRSPRVARKLPPRSASAPAPSLNEKTSAEMIDFGFCSISSSTMRMSV